ncbi:hypothetical protein BVRB_6g137360 [Beta vulgaris subsp. vulgaris]|nr:hypothetical protein BVRB_6g137360 [Beta vulgaris subsp. vulgaris]
MSPTPPPFKNRNPNLVSPIPPPTSLASLHHHHRTNTLTLPPFKNLVCGGAKTLDLQLYKMKKGVMKEVREGEEELEEMKEEREGSGGVRSHLVVWWCRGGSSGVELHLVAWWCRGGSGGSGGVVSNW